jgi:hypothetical protein
LKLNLDELLTQILIFKKIEKEIVFESSVLAWIRIRIEQKCWIRIRIKSIRIHNPVFLVISVILYCTILVIVRDAPDTGTDFAGYPANLKAGYRISGAGRIPDIRPDFQLNIQISNNI